MTLQRGPSLHQSIHIPTAFLGGISIPDICKAAKWTVPLTFTSHYRLDVQARRDASFGLTGAVLLDVMTAHLLCGKLVTHLQCAFMEDHKED